MLSRLGHWAQRRPHVEVWTNVLGVGRTLLAVATGMTLAVNGPATLFAHASGLPDGPACRGVREYGLFCVIPPSGLNAARFFALALLVITASGWRPRVTCIPHWWITFSCAANWKLLEGGDHLAAVLTFLLLPVCLADGRRWHWRLAQHEQLRGPLAGLVGASTVVAIKLQVAGVYLHSSVAKLTVEEWVDGTAIYYWLGDPTFGASEFTRGLFSALFRIPLAVAALTWGPILVEFLLFLGAIGAVAKRWNLYLLATGLLFHATIALTMGLVSFGVVMSGALVLGLRTWSEPFAPWATRLIPRHGQAAVLAPATPQRVREGA